MSADYDCIVLGAGIAGVTAARDLSKAGFSVLVLEGSDRIGGRMSSKRDFVRGRGLNAGKFPLEEGAEFIHVSEKKRRRRVAGSRPMGPYRPYRYHEFWDELREQGFTTGRFPKGGLVGKSHNRVYYADWAAPRSVVEASIKNSDLCELKGMFDDIRGWKKREDTVRNFVASHHYRGRGLDMALYALTAHTPGFVDGEAGVSMEGLRIDGIADQLEEPVEHRLLDGRGGLVGYDTLPRRIATEAKRSGCKILTNKLVSGVARSDDGVTVEVDSGTTYSARAVVCTFSVGMLQAKGEEIFGPLFRPKRKPLEFISMGGITKFSIEFKFRFWDDDLTVLSNPLGEARTFFSSYQAGDAGPHVLTGLLMGEDHKTVHSKNDSAAFNWVFRELGKIYKTRVRDAFGKAWDKTLVVGGAGSPNFHRKDWENDQFALGGNSYIRATGKSAKNAREFLKSPLRTLPVFWAGEATAPAYTCAATPENLYQPLAVHGAYWSGVQVADDMRSFLRVGESRFRTAYAKKYGGEAADRVRQLSGEVAFKISEAESVWLRAAARQVRLRPNEHARRIVRQMARRHAHDDGAVHELTLAAPFDTGRKPVKFKVDPMDLDLLWECARELGAEDPDAVAKYLLKLAMYNGANPPRIRRPR